MTTKDVSPYTGEWIEIVLKVTDPSGNKVSPYTGEWIEICTLPVIAAKIWSHLTQVSGLK